MLFTVTPLNPGIANLYLPIYLASYDTFPVLYIVLTIHVAIITAVLGKEDLSANQLSLGFGWLTSCTLPRVFFFDSISLVFL